MFCSNKVLRKKLLRKQFSHIFIFYEKYEKNIIKFNYKLIHFQII